MKKLTLTLLFTMLALSVTAQCADTTLVENDTTTIVTFDIPEVSPQFPGGHEALMQYLHKQVKYPQLASRYGVEGHIVMNFVVNQDGSVSDISAEDCKIERFVTSKFSQETLARQKELQKEFALLFAKEGARAIRNMPRWSPARSQGKCVRAKLRLPIRFAMPDK